MNFTLFQSDHYNHRYLDDRMHLILFKKKDIHNEKMNFISYFIGLSFDQSELSPYFGGDKSGS